MVHSLIEKDVQDVLLRTRTSHRRPGQIPYPAQYTHANLSHDNWDHMFLVSCCRSLTMHQFETPPLVVLDLGCGGGFWAIEAAKKWPKSTVFGFDKEDIQPRLSSFEHYRELSRRVRWVHGNLLEQLPFPPDHFDLVRVVGIGLGVPEDEWQFVFEEINRVMKDGAVLEIIEEDLIFPSAPPPKPRFRSCQRPPPIAVNLPLGKSLSSSKSSVTLKSDPWSDRGSVPSLNRSPSIADTKFERSRVLPPFDFGTQSLIARSPSHRVPPPLPTCPEYEYGPHPLDHTRLKTAWDAMLSRRFISPNLLSVLPFYLSSLFVDIESHPAIKIPLPDNSPSAAMPNFSQISNTNDMFFNLTPSRSGSSNADCPNSANCRQSKPTWPSMHLAKTVQTVISCKEAIWREYQHLFSEDDARLVTRTARPDSARAQSSPASNREAFETDWTSWENDMMDRISMRNLLTSQFGWAEPPGERPDWRVWRDSLERRSFHHSPSSSDTDSTMSTDTGELCRQIRGFVVWKQTVPSD